MDVHWPSVLSFSPTQVAYTWFVWTEYQKSCIKIATCRRNQSSFSHWSPHQNTTWASLPRHSTRQRGEYKDRWGPWLRPINCGSQMEGIPMSPRKPGCFEDFWGISYWRLLNSNPIRFLGGVICLDYTIGSCLKQPLHLGTSYIVWVEILYPKIGLVIGRNGRSLWFAMFCDMWISNLAPSQAVVTPTCIAACQLQAEWVCPRSWWDQPKFSSFFVALILALTSSKAINTMPQTSKIPWWFQSQAFWDKLGDGLCNGVYRMTWMEPPWVQSSNARSKGPAVSVPLQTVPRLGSLNCGFTSNFWPVS